MTDTLTTEEPSELTPEFEGSWEKSGRNPATAAILGFIVVGIIYAYAQGFIGFVILTFQHAGSASDSEKAKTVLDLFAARAIATKNPIRYSVVISEFLFMLFPVFWLVRRWHTKDFPRYTRFKRVPLRDVLLAVAATALFFPASSFISDLFLRELNFPDFLMRINAELFTAYSPTEFVWVIAVVCITPAICEEIFFRGYFQRTLERTIGPASIYVAGILFGLYHMRPLNLVSLSILGIMIGFFFYRSKSIVPGMAAHFTNNFLAVLTVYKFPDGSPRLPFFSTDFSTVSVIVATIAAGITIFIYYRATAIHSQPVNSSNY